MSIWHVNQYNEVNLGSALILKNYIEQLASNKVFSQQYSETTHGDVVK